MATVMEKPTLNQSWFVYVDGRDPDNIDEARTIISLAIGQIQMAKKKVIVRFAIEEGGD